MRSGGLLLTHKERMQNIKYTWKDDSKVNVQTSNLFLNYVP